MYVLKRYSLAVFFCFLSMLFWGSWINTKRMTPESWRFELYYWDYGWGLLLTALIFALTMGSRGKSGRNFLDDLQQAKRWNLGSALVGGVVFNAANILLVNMVRTVGMAVAFPMMIGVSIVLGVLVNYLTVPKGNPLLLAFGSLMIVAAVVVDGLASQTLPSAAQTAGVGAKEIVVMLVGGVLFGNFYRFVAKPMATDFEKMGPGTLSPYSAVVLFSLGVVLSSFAFNTAVMLIPFDGDPVSFLDYIHGTAQDHFWGIVGGAMWAAGIVLNVIACGKAGPAISFALGQAGTMVAALWGVFVWHEFRDAPPGAGWLLAAMFLVYILGIALLIQAGRSQSVTSDVSSPHTNQ
jgi:glucose uptake protein